MERKMHEVSCPVCGMELLKGSCGKIDMECPNCRTRFSLEISEDQISYRHVGKLQALMENIRMNFAI